MRLITKLFLIALFFAGCKTDYKSEEHLFSVPQPYAASVTTDSRPIGILHISDPSRVTQTNPSGWLFQELANGQTDIGPYITRSLDVMYQSQAQGMIVWDLEGSKFPSEMYLGSPDLAISLNPEWQFQDDFFRRYKAAGFKVGLLIRPDKFNQTTKKMEASPTPFETLLHKATYAKKRWGCTLFYVDTNHWDWRTSGKLLPPSMFRALKQKLPGCVFFPEHEHVLGGVMTNPDVFWEAMSYYAETVPYQELRMNETGTILPVKNMNRYAKTALNISVENLKSYEAVVRAAMLRGDIMFLNMWWMSQTNQDFIDIISN